MQHPLQFFDELLLSRGVLLIRDEFVPSEEDQLFGGISFDADKVLKKYRSFSTIEWNRR
jgi:hypothetical protein